MDRHRLSAVVARSGQNVTHLSGLAYPGTLAGHRDLADSVRGVGIRAEGSPAVTPCISPSLRRSLV
jgi:hypothetical protein